MDIPSELRIVRSKQCTQAFFTFCCCRDDFATKLSIPKAFSEKHGEFLLQKQVSLKTAESTRFWDVRITKNSNGDFHIGGGWPEFVNGNNILATHFLVVRIVSTSTLHVTIFRDNGCFYPRPPSPPPSPPPRVQKTCFRFVRELKPYHFETKRLEVPLSFAVATGIGEKEHVKLRDSGAREWPVKVTNRNIKMYSLTSGWIQFLKGNRLQIGNILVFEFVPDSDCAVNVVVMASQAGQDLLLQAGSGGVLY